MATATGGWREARRQSARDAIVDVAWQLVHEEGLGSLSLRELAKRAGVTTPTIYAYFESKHAIYDAMFGKAAGDFADRMTEPYGADEGRALLVASVRRFVQFCTTEPARYQLLFQRTIPGFEPSPESFAPAVRALDASRRCLAANGVVEPRHVDLWTAITTGLVDQQIANDPGGTRWSSLVDELVDMFLAHCRTAPPAAPGQPTRRRGRGHQG
ncbi:MAG TPA: TetR/AcrR family transcriptional regulator [Acidimicrobiales bacterium]|nr:TetR/AcrR family transcriptional regulator [Acidimicrobiales bacterium]